MPNQKVVPKPIVLALFAVAAGVQAADFTWRGQLADGGEPAHGSYDLSVAAYADEGASSPLSGPIEFYAVSVANGEFAVTLPLDAAGELDRVWLEVSVRDAGDPGGYETLAQRQAVDLAPAGVCPAAWVTTGNAGTGPGNFLGTTDASGVELRADNRAFLRATPVNVAIEGDAPNLILGSAANAVAIGGSIVGATISGGGTTFISAMPCPSCRNQVGANFASIGGGHSNTAGGFSSRVGGGTNNLASASGSTIAGGQFNEATKNHATVSGGSSNDATGNFAAIGGGSRNVASGNTATVGGGADNVASGPLATVGGGDENVASGSRATVGGGDRNVASGDVATVGGGFLNRAGGNYSFAAGHRSIVRDPAQSGDADGDEGTFVWSDALDIFDDFTSSGPNQFLIQANGGFGLNSTPINSIVEMSIQANPDSQYANLFLRQRDVNAGVLFSAGDATGSNNNAALLIDQYDGSAQTRRLTLATNGDLTVTAAAIKPGGGSWSAPSDARLKKNVAPLDGALDRLLALEGVSFEYADPDPARRPAGTQVGFVAQQVQPLFPGWVGQDADGYLTVGPQGFEALAVEALRELKVEKDLEIAALRAENEALIARLEANEAVTAELRAQVASANASLIAAAESR